MKFTIAFTDKSKIKLKSFNYDPERSSLCGANMSVYSYDKNKVISFSLTNPQIAYVEYEVE